MDNENSIDIARVKGSEQERTQLARTAEIAGLSVSSFLRRAIGLDPLPRGTPKRGRKPRRKPAAIDQTR